MVGGTYCCLHVLQENCPKGHTVAFHIARRVNVMHIFNGFTCMSHLIYAGENYHSKRLI